MSPERLQELLQAVAQGKLSVDNAVGELRNLPFEDVDGARVDHHRALRQGAAEVIFGAGKTPAQIARITEALLNAGQNVLCTRASLEAFEAVKEVAHDAGYDDLARIITVTRRPAAKLGRVGVVCAGTSDLPVAREALVCARFFGMDAELFADVGVAGLHRLLHALPSLQQYDVLIAVAGMEGALPSVLGGLVGMPVIAVPTSIGYGTAFGGVAAMLGMLNSCASGLTVVNIDNGFGAAAAAHRILRKPTR